MKLLNCLKKIKNKLDCLIYFLNIFLNLVKTPSKIKIRNFCYWDSTNIIEKIAQLKPAY